MSRLLEQQRAVFAMKFITEWQKKDQKAKDKLLTLVQKAPVQILQNGLGQSLAFLLADNEGKIAEKRKPSGCLYDQLQAWLCGDQESKNPGRVYASGDLIEQLMQGSSDQYIRAQQEALAVLYWFKQFAVANLK